MVASDSDAGRELVRRLARLLPGPIWVSCMRLAEFLDTVEQVAGITREEADRT